MFDARHTAGEGTFPTKCGWLFENICATFLTCDSHYVVYTFPSVSLGNALTFKHNKIDDNATELK